MSEHTADSCLLRGLRVVELGHSLAAPLCGMLLAEQGAEVVRVVDPNHPPVDPVLDALLARGKTELSADAHRPATLQAVHRLIARADVVLEDETPRPWFSFRQIRDEQNPGLVSCRIPAFPGDDPRSKLPGYEAVAGAGGLLYTKPLGRPRYHDFPIGSVTAALYAADAIMAALVARQRCGQGQSVEVSLCHSAYAAQVLQILVKTGIPRGFMALKMIGSPFMRCWPCQDDRFVYLHITLPKHNARMLELLEENGHRDEVRKLRSLMSEQTVRDPSQVGSIKEAKKLKAIYSAVFRSRTADAWETILGHDLCCIKVRTVEEWLHDSLDAGMSDACEVDDPQFGTLLGPGPLMTAPDHPADVTPRRCHPAAAEALIARWEAAPSEASDEVEQPESLRHALDGIKVLDLSRVIAGPCSARVLAEFGADVLSVQSETRLDWALSFHLLFNAGKRSVTLDFTDDQGKAKLNKLIDRFAPDVLVHNYRHLDLARTIGVGPEQMLERFPQLAYSHLSAYGNHGVWQKRPGFEQVVQAVSGMQLAYAEGGRPKLLPSPIIDIGCGLLGAFGSLCALYHRGRTGRGAVVTTHLTSVSVLLQLNRVADFQRDACLAHAEQRGQSAKVDEDRQLVGGLLRTLTGEVCLCGPRGQIRRWLSRCGQTISPGREWDNALKFMKFRPLPWLQKSLVDAGVQDAVALLPYPNMRHLIRDIRRFDPRPEPVVRKRPFPGSPQDLTFVASPARLSLTPIADIDPPPVRGSHTAEVLRSIGESVADGAGMMEYPPDKPLPLWLAGVIRWGYFAWKSGNI